jgi:hypothetical protein
MRSLEEGGRPLILRERGREAAKPSTARTCTHEERGLERGRESKGDAKGGGGGGGGGEGEENWLQCLELKVGWGDEKGGGH